MELSAIRDADFYAAVHALIVRYERAGSLERRQSDRHEYRHVQWVAPYLPGQPPEQAELRPIECHDLSTTGFSYLAVEPPPCDHWLVALGETPHTFLIAEVKYCRPASPDPSGLCLVGCRFVGRLG